MHKYTHVQEQAHYAYNMDTTYIVCYNPSDQGTFSVLRRTEKRRKNKERRRKELDKRTDKDIHVARGVIKKTLREFCKHHLHHASKFYF